MIELSEQQLREDLQLFNELMSCPHGQLDKTFEVHKAIRNKNPSFYGKTAAWYMDNGTVRDHKVVFLRALFNAPQAQLREEGWALLQEQPFGIVHRVPSKSYSRSLRSAIIHYLANMESHNLDYQILRGAKDLRKIVRRLHVPTEAMYTDNPNLLKIGVELFTGLGQPELRGVFKSLHDAMSSEEVEQILRKTRLPAFIAVSALKVRTPKIMRVLIQMMSPSELLQSLNYLGRMRVLEPNLETVLAKIERAINDRRLSAGRVYSVKKQLDPAVVPSAVFDALEVTTEKKIRKRSKIKDRVSIHFDASGSMERAIAMARMIAQTLSVACTNPPTVYETSRTPQKIVPSEYTPMGWDKAFSLVTAGGGTPLGFGVRLMVRNGEEADVIIMITDGGENSYPRFSEEYPNLSNKPRVIAVILPGENSGAFERSLRMNNIALDELRVNSVDQYSIDQIISLIGKVSPMETIMDIMEIEIPARDPKTKVAQYWVKQADTSDSDAQDEEN